MSIRPAGPGSSSKYVVGPAERDFRWYAEHEVTPELVDPPPARGRGVSSPLKNRSAGGGGRQGGNAEQSVLEGEAAQGDGRSMRDEIRLFSLIRGWVMPGSGRAVAA